MGARVWQVARLVCVFLIGIEIGSAVSGNEVLLNISAALGLAVLAVAWAVQPRRRPGRD